MRSSSDRLRQRRHAQKRQHARCQRTRRQQVDASAARHSFVAARRFALRNQPSSEFGQHRARLRARIGGRRQQKCAAVALRQQRLQRCSRVVAFRGAMQPQHASQAGWRRIARAAAQARDQRHRGHAAGRSLCRHTHRHGSGGPSAVACAGVPATRCRVDSSACTSRLCGVSCTGSCEPNGAALAALSHQRWPLRGRPTCRRHDGRLQPRPKRVTIAA